MRTKRFEPNAVAAAAELLKAGGTLAFPTDTVYGLGVIYGDMNALQKLKEAKGRPEEKPIPVMIADLDQLYELAEVNETARKLADAYMPGGLTLILKKRACVSDAITNGFATIAIRMSEDPLVRSLIQACRKPLLVSSANRSGEASGVTASQVLDQLDGRIDGIVMGQARGAVPSTIVDVSTENITVARVGVIAKSEIDAVLNNKQEERQ